MIRVDHLSVTRGKKLVLSDISADFARGRVTAIIGPNGAGKSTLIRALAGLLLPSHGTIGLDDQPLTAVPLAERARRIGYLPQDSQPSWAITVRDLVSLGRMPHRSLFAAPNGKDEAAIQRALADTETLELAERTVDTLSGGECARAKIARVLAGDPDWILADEPLANLDPPHQRDLLRLLKQSAAAGKGVIVILHQLSAAARVADDILILRNGDVVSQGPCLETLTPHNLERSFGMAFDRVAYEGGFAIVPRG
jgi:iron complex transport system ATP-binding protein